MTGINLKRNPMRIRAIAVAFTLISTAAIAADPPRQPTADEKAAVLDGIDSRINTMTARVSGIMSNLHDSLMSCNQANQKAADDLNTANQALEVQKSLVAELTKERDELKKPKE
jgi:hypothetical protein